MPDFTRRTFLAVGGAALVSSWAATAGVYCAEPQWVDHRSHGPFQCRATFPLHGLIPLFQELSELEVQLQRTLAIPPAEHTIDIYLLRDEASYRRLLESFYPPVPYRRALFLQRGGRRSVYAYLQEELPIDLRHECTHALLHANLPMVPLWLDEGLAEYFEMPADQRAFHHPHLRNLRWHFRFGRVPNIEKLERCHELDEMGPAEYRFSWVWVHFMLHGPLPAHRALVHYLADIQRGNPPGQLSERLEREVPDLQKQLAQHFKNWRR